MKKQAITLTLALGLLLPVSTAFADISAKVNTNATVQLRGESGENDDATSTRSSRGADSSMRVEVEDNDKGEKNEENASTTEDGNDDSPGESHRSAVASFVQSLLEDADRDGGIGAEVRAVAQSQQDSASTTAAAMAKVETRSALKTFFLGTDWKHTGALRSEVAKGAADIARLEAARDRATDATVKADLTVQIEALKDAQADIETFVEAHESTFSLFGWFVRLFS